MTPSSLYGWFSRTAAERHGDIAHEIGRRRYPDGVLERRATGIAEAIATRLDRPPSRVGLLTSRSIATYAGYLAVLRLGASVVPMKPQLPASRNAMISSDAGVDATIVDETSLLATRLTARIRTDLGVDVALADLFTAPTLAEMSRIVESAGRAASTAALTPIRRIDRSRYTISSEEDSSGA
jgi:acyl-CoA synthetase (AMP-forming)/AMP-acid ligase II